MFWRLLGGFGRAAVVIIILVMPAFLLPNVSVASLEVSLVVAVIAAALTVFEYASTHPSLIDFRFAPPYNRVRFLCFAAQVILLSFLCRASAGLDSFGPDVLAFADWAIAMTDWPLSPVRIVIEAAATIPDRAQALLTVRAAAVSFLSSFVLLMGFAAILWIARWPVARRDFNLWINLPTFTPGYAEDTERRLFRDGWFNLLSGLAFLYLAPILVFRFGGGAANGVLAEYQGLLWAATAWGLIASSLAIRGLAVLKVAWLVRRARR
ncbi:hypothetical protein HMH01_01725 [Halovulum dunhuangense]|uniref:Uncharacterized protein n=1 Tax=Halovulum dunhuangense TaxID=1505036 RepID=A0A849KYE1_9RHOB|nr:hypothetical protein [Halovulum dunhuangense]NNU79146.1 hypothetical protein [Halovulum dunhuangense]